jgi:hypothetical protein
VEYYGSHNVKLLVILVLLEFCVSFHLVLCNSFKIVPASLLDSGGPVPVVVVVVVAAADSVPSQQPAAKLMYMLSVIAR